MATLILQNNLAQNAQSIDLSGYLDVQRDEGMDPYNPSFTEKVFSHSLLKEGGTLALESLHLKELVFPLKLNSTSAGGLATLVQQINQILTVGAGATASWQDDGLSQPTIFDLVSGQFDLEYDYRMAQQHWLKGKLRLFCQPLGHTSGPRPYAAASGVGPLLMISPYASGGANILGASTQAGVAGFGGQQQPSGGVFYQGNPSLAGDAPALLQVSYAGPLPNQATNAGVVPNVAVGLLPDPLYRVLVTAPEIVIAGSAARIANSTVPASQYIQIPPFVSGDPNAKSLAFLSFRPLPSGSTSAQLLWAGNHRLFGIARASGGTASFLPGLLQTQPNSLMSIMTSASVSGDWGLYDLGTFSVRGSEAAQQSISVLLKNTAPSVAMDLCAFAMLPDAACWFLNPKQVSGSQYGWPLSAAQSNTVASAPYTNTLLLDDLLADQFIYAGQSQTFAPSPVGMAASSGRISPYSRGLVPRPDPRNGLPIVAILGVGQNTTSGSNTTVNASWTSQQNLRTLAQVTVLERTRYVLP